MKKPTKPKKKLTPEQKEWSDFVERTETEPLYQHVLDISMMATNIQKSDRTSEIHDYAQRIAHLAHKLQDKLTEFSQELSEPEECDCCAGYCCQECS